MKTSIKTLAYAAVASMLFLACNEATELTASNGDENTSIGDVTKNQPEPQYDPSPKPADPDPPVMICTDDIPGKCYPIDKPPYDPSSEPPPYKPGPAIINKDVELWMQEQLASGSSEKKLIVISEMHFPKTSPPGLSASGYRDRKGEYFVESSFNGNKISAEAYYRILEEYRKGINTGKRNLYIPGEIIGDDSITWTVLMTAEELAELLSKKYDELSIRFYEETLDE
jgi:hypothetical protein